MKRLLLTLLILGIGFIANAQYTKLFDFAGAANGSSPKGDLISDGTFLYGMTATGGVYDKGTIFKIKMDGTGFVKMYDFDGATNGGYPYGSLLLVDSSLYGMTYSGGTSCTTCGIIFKIKTDGTGFLKLTDFPGWPDGSNPYGSLITDGTYLYGITQDDGTLSRGRVFKVNLDGTGYAAIKNLNSTSGHTPYGSLVSDGTFLYGMTYYGGSGGGCTGPGGCGTLFKIMPDGTLFSKLIDFTFPIGRHPRGTPFFDGTFLYGMTSGGGTNGLGLIFKIKPDSSGHSILYSFALAPDGNIPYGSLVSDGTFLYGMTQGGGPNISYPCGTIFKIKPDGSGYQKLHDLDSLNGVNPYGSLLVAGNALYGMTHSGGTNNMGVIFKYDLLTNDDELSNSGNQLIIHPNPAHNSFTISFNGQSSMVNGQLTICDVMGREVLEQQLHSQLSTVNFYLSAGIYFVKVSAGDKVYQQKLVVE